MALKQSLEKVRKTKNRVKQDILDTTASLRDLRPRPVRAALNRRMEDIRPLRKIRKRLMMVGEPEQQTEQTGENVGEDSS